MRLVFALAALLVLLVGFACSSPQTNRVELPAPVESTTLGPGDVFELHIVNEEKLPTTYTVSPDGTVDFPYVHRIQVAGLEPQMVVDLLRKKLIDDQFLSDPSVMISVKEYRSKFVNVLGQVKSPGTFSLVPGFTLVQAISKAGGMSSIADRNNVTLTRTTGKQRRTMRLSIDSITEGRSSDIPLQSGDVITVGERVF
ncbi:MAG TPA: polysaccharide biosynthesis/export family protein [Polyangiaceae bacterium]|nr:polysaccharide biosynthesis/export family protein [Polyangiaceae bacterium]